MIQRKAADYHNVLSGVVELLHAARRASARVVNSLMTATYWEIGQRIVEHEQAGQERAAYGEEVLERLSRDLGKKFGRGFGLIQLRTMRQFHLTFPWPGNFPSAIGKSRIRQSVIDESSDAGGLAASTLTPLVQPTSKSCLFLLIPTIELEEEEGFIDKHAGCRPHGLPTRNHRASK